MSLLMVARLAAAVIAVVTIAFLFIHDSLRSDNIFLVPDLVVCALLLAAAGWRGRRAVAALAVSLAMASGVFLTSVSSYLVDGELGVPSLIGAVAAAGTAAALAAQGAGATSGAALTAGSGDAAVRRPTR